MSDSEPEEEGQDLAAMSKKEFRLHMKRQRRQGAAPPLEEEEEEDGGGATQRGAANHYGDHRKWKKVDVGDMVMGGSEGGFMELEELDEDDIVFADAPPPSSRKETKAATKIKESPKAQKLKEKRVRLEAQLAALQAEEEAAQQPDDSASDEDSDAPTTSKDGKKRKRKSRAERERAKKAKEVHAEAAAAKAAAAPVKAVKLADISRWKPFGLDKRLERGLSELGFSAPTKIQEECLPSAVLHGHDIIGAAETGSGKTLAFGLPILHHILREGGGAGTSAAATGVAEDGADEDAMAVERDDSNDDHRLRALIIAPTRELALQVTAHLTEVGKHAGIRVVPIVGGMSQQKQMRLLHTRPEVVVATPGRLWDYMSRGEKHLVNLRRLTFLVIDEADRMVEKGHYAELENILARLPTVKRAANADSSKKRSRPPLWKKDQPGAASKEKLEEPEEEVVTRQTFVFSATLALPAELRRRLNLKVNTNKMKTDKTMMETLMAHLEFRGKPKVVDLTSEEVMAGNLSEAAVACTEETRDQYLYYVLNRHPGQTIVFCNAISALRRVVALMKLLGIPAAALHANMQQRQRLKALDRFTSGEAAALIATDVAARGLDIKNVRCVIHYQLANSAETYVHRSGRTARAGADGLSIALVVPSEKGRYIAMCKAMGKLDGLPDFPIDASYMPGVRKRLKLAAKADELARTQSKAKAEKTWRQRQAEAMEILLDSDDDTDGGEDERSDSFHQSQKKKDALKSALAALNAELKKPLLPDASGVKSKFLGEGSRLLTQMAAGASSELVKTEALAAFADTAPANKSVLRLGGKPRANPAIAKIAAIKKKNKEKAVRKDESRKRRGVRQER